MPNASSPNALVAPFWDDFHFGVSGSSIWYEQQGAAPNRRVVVSWLAAPFFGATTINATFQAILQEGGGVTFQYLSSNFPTARRPLGTSASIGAENQTGTIAFTHSSNSSSSVTYPMAITAGCLAPD